MQRRGIFKRRAHVILYPIDVQSTLTVYPELDIEGLDAVITATRNNEKLA